MNSAKNLTEVPIETKCSSLQVAIIKTILYFDVFKYPITAIELHRFCQNIHANSEEINEAMDGLIKRNLVKTMNGFIFIGNGEAMIKRRVEGNLMAKKYYQKAWKYSKIISFFPYVEGIGITGSLSKNYMEKESDIDYFIISKSGRLWVCRTFLVLFKKIFLLNSHQYFCINYFIDTDSLEIQDRNIFTATELVFVMPTFNINLYNSWMDANSWTKEYYPNFPKQQLFGDIHTKNYRIKTLLEKILNTSLGEQMDTLFFKITLRHWKYKFKEFNDEEFDLKMRTRKNISKHHPNGYQTKVLNALTEKILHYEEEFGISLS